MYKKVRKNKEANFSCPFCNKNIPASVKTEIFYKSSWIDGCSECYIQSIEKPTHLTFQTS